MKKISITILICILILATCGLSACLPLAFFDSDSETADKLFQSLVQAMDSGDKQQVKALFASNTTQQVSDFDQQLSSLMDFYQGKTQEYAKTSFATFSNKNNGVSTKYYNMYYTCQTEVDSYVIVLLWYIEDTSNSGNVGIWSMYIAKTVDATDTFWYDWNNGINIVSANQLS